MKKDKRSPIEIIDDLIMKFELVACYIMISVMIVSVFANAIVRLFGFAIDWSTDVAQLLFIWVSILGSDMAMKKSRHVGMDLIMRRMPEKAAKLIMVVIYIACIVFMAVVAYYGFALAVQNRLRMFNTIKISYSFVTLAVPVGFCLMIFTILRQLACLVMNKPDCYADKFEDREKLEDVV